MSHSSVSVQSERCVDVVFCEAIKQLLISSPPRVLCLHLKRFSQQGRSMRSLRKNGSHIAFPLVLNLAPFCTQNCMVNDHVHYNFTSTAWVMQAGSWPFNGWVVRTPQTVLCLEWVLVIHCVVNI